jgi:undecaprenyl-diphosphatase
MPRFFTVLTFAIILSVNWVTAESLDQRLFDQIHTRWQKDWLDNPMQFCTDVGEAEMGIAICAGVGLFGRPKARESAQLALFADGASAAMTYGLKNIVNRPRPEGPTERSNSSFPSGHATGAFALATVFSHQYPKLSIPLYITATGVAISRIYLGRHYPSDVLAGAAIGFTTAKLTLHYKDKILGFEFDTFLHDLFCKEENQGTPDNQTSITDKE